VFFLFIIDTHFLLSFHPFTKININQSNQSEKALVKGGGERLVKALLLANLSPFGSDTFTLPPVSNL
jgi:hypothetical protein